MRLVSPASGADGFFKPPVSTTFRSDRPVHAEMAAISVAPILRATAADLPYVVHLQKQHGDAVGFLPRAALLEKIELGRVWLATENGEPAGFLHHGTLARPEVRVFQAAIQYDARRRQLASTLVSHLVARAADAGASGISLRCLSYLDANAFWSNAGFSLLATEPGARGTLNVWGRRLCGTAAISGRRSVDLTDTGSDGGSTTTRDRSIIPPVSVPERDPFVFHSRLHPCPACGRLTPDSWCHRAVRRRLCRDCLTTEQAARGSPPT